MIEQPYEMAISDNIATAKRDSRPEIKIKLPLASIIITNYNYSRYVEASIQSALDQIYPNVEIIVVDDASTDDSVNIIERFISARPPCRFIRRRTNGGQGAAMLDGFRASSGDFVCFLDADDILFSNFISTHVFVHLSLRQQVAFTSSNLVLINSTGRVLTGSYSGTFCPPLPHKSDSEASLGLLQISTDIDAILNPQRQVITRCIHFSNDRVGYHWSSCSGLVFKRAALDIWCFDDVLVKSRICGDFYWILSHYISGSAIIDTKLGGYRIHGRNGFSAWPLIDGIDPSCRAGREHCLEILRDTATMITGPRLEFYLNLLGIHLYSSLIANLQKFCEIFNDSNADVRFFAAGMAASFHQLRALSSDNAAVQVLRGLDPTHQERDNLAAERDSLRAQRDSLLCSTSWRLTAPVRGLKNIFRVIFTRQTDAP